jgi:hypothetical protein
VKKWPGKRSLNVLVSSTSTHVLKRIQARLPQGAAMNAGILWPIKTSLTAYIESLDDGQVEVTAPAARRPEGFWFPLREGATTEPGDSMEFGGSVRLTGHWGMLDVEFRDPRLDFDDAGAVLLVRERGGKQDRFVAIARLTRQPGTEATEADFSATLTGEGAFLLGGQYPAGTALSPLRLDLTPRS